MNEKALLADSAVVSVVVPIHNVEPYLDAALTSIRLQRYPYLEVILVDDGSTDQSTRIAKRFTALDSRFRLIVQDAAGPGAARNLGAKLATGRYLTFVDADDVLPINGIYRLVVSALRTGSDLVIGAPQRLRGTVRLAMPWLAEVHREERLRTTLEQTPGVLLNPFGWGKLFSREFFEREIGGFPEKVYYEDQVPAALAYTRVQCFDVLSEVTYLWRIREDGSSITQNRKSEKSLQDRIQAIAEVKKILAVAASSSVQQFWVADVLFAALRPFYESLPSSKSEYRDNLQRICAELWNELSPAAVESADPDALAAVRSLIDG